AGGGVGGQPGGGHVGDIDRARRGSAVQSDAPRDAWVQIQVQREATVLKGEEAVVRLVDLQPAARVQPHLWLWPGVLDVSAIKVGAKVGARRQGDGRRTRVDLGRGLGDAADLRRCIERAGRRRDWGYGD